MRRGWVALALTTGLALGACGDATTSGGRVSAPPALVAASGASLRSCPLGTDSALGQNAWGLGCERLDGLTAKSEVDVRCWADTVAPTTEAAGASKRWFQVAVDAERYPQTGWVWSGLLERTPAVGECRRIGPSTMATVRAKEPLRFEVTGSCTSAGGRLSSESSGFTSRDEYSVTAWHEDGRPVPGLMTAGQIDIGGSVGWRWSCVGADPGRYRTEVVDRATGRVVRATFAIGGSAARSSSPKVSVVTAAAAARTWTDVYTGRGDEGPKIAAGAKVPVICRMNGFVAADGNAWWYRLAGRDWEDPFYAPADALSSGSVDESVPRC